MRSGSGGEGGNCIAVVSIGELSQENPPPTAGLSGGDGELQRGLAGGATEDGGAGEEPLAQRRELGTLRLAKPALEADAQVVGADGEVARRFGGPK